MHKNTRRLVIMVLALLASGPQAHAKKEPKRLLFAGNSMIGHVDGNCGTYPYGLIEELARAEGHLVPDVSTTLRGGSQTTDHVNGVGSAPDWDLDPMFWDNS